MVEMIVINGVDFYMDQEYGHLWGIVDATWLNEYLNLASEEKLDENSNKEYTCYILSNYHSIDSRNGRFLGPILYGELYHSEDDFFNSFGENKTKIENFFKGE